MRALSSEYLSHTGSNQAMQPTAGCFDVPLHIMKTRPLQATLAFTSGG